jgi:hypothetical protein
MFAGVVGPACVVVFGKLQPQPETTLYYFTPKPRRVRGVSKRSGHISQGFVVEPQDVNAITHREAAEQAVIWPVLALGGQRDLALIKSLQRFPTLKSLEESHQVITREGVVFGNRQKLLDNKELRDLPILENPQLPSSSFQIEADALSRWREPRVDRDASTDFEPFKMPQLIIKQGFSTRSGRFRAAIVVRSQPSTWGLICSQSYLTVRDLNAQAPHIKAACVSYNSVLASYYLWNTSSRLGHYRTEVLAEELVSVPLPVAAPEVSDFDSFKAVDKAARELFSVSPAEWTLVEDFLEYTLPDALRKTPGPGRCPTKRKGDSNVLEPDLSEYVKTFSRVVKATFGKNKGVAGTIFSESGTDLLPVRMLTIHLDIPTRAPLTIQAIKTEGLFDELAHFYNAQLKKKVRDSTGDGLGFQRVAYLFHPNVTEGTRAMNITIVKPDERRYWTRSVAMRDADQLAGAILDAAASQKSAA